jgi:hypothetical protein
MRDFRITGWVDNDHDYDTASRAVIGLIHA